MKFCVIYFFIIYFFVSTLNGQEIAKRIQSSTLDSVKINYHKKGKKMVRQEFSIDVQSILIDFIPKLVLKDRQIRYQWDKRKSPDIYVYKHVITFDSVSYYEDHALKFCEGPKTNAIDTSYSLSHFPYPEFETTLFRYTKLPCFDNFNYKFIFVDNIMKADFVVSTIKEDKRTNSINIYIWHIPNFTTNTTYSLSIEQTWDSDCYRVNILNQNITDIYFSMDQIEELYNIRDRK